MIFKFVKVIRELIDGATEFMAVLRAADCPMKGTLLYHGETCRAEERSNKEEVDEGCGK